MPTLVEDFELLEDKKEAFMLKGYRTYLAAGGLVLGAAAGWMTGHMDPQTAIMSALQGLAFIFLRRAIPSQP